MEIDQVIAFKFLNTTNKAGRGVKDKIFFQSINEISYGFVNLKIRSLHVHFYTYDS